MSQIVMTLQSLRDPLLPNRNLRPSMIFNIDRVGIKIQRVGKALSFRVMPKGYKDQGGVRKQRGKTDLDFMTKHDILIAGDGSLVSLLSIIKAKELPAGTTIKLQVRCIFCKFCVCVCVFLL